MLQELRETERFSSYKDVQKWLKAVEGIEMSYTEVNYIVRYRLKAKLKVTRPVHIKQHPKAFEELKKLKTKI